jgi:hypothetical protein
MASVWSREHSRFFSPPLLIAVPLHTLQKNTKRRNGHYDGMSGYPHHIGSKCQSESDHIRGSNPGNAQWAPAALLTGFPCL